MNTNTTKLKVLMKDDNRHARAISHKIYAKLARFGQKSFFFKMFVRMAPKHTYIVKIIF